MNNMKVNNKFETFSNLLIKLKQLKNEVLPLRIEKVRTVILSEPNRLHISAFELMEHNFRENSHSNVLGYLLDTKLTGNLGAEILIKILSK